MASPQQASPPSGAVPLPDHLPHDIQELVPFALPLWEQWWFWLGVAMLIAALLAIVLCWWRRRRSRVVAPIPVEDPMLVARRACTLLVPGEPWLPHEYFFALSMALRRFIETVSPVRATDLTTNELRRPLRQHLKLPTAELEALLEFLVLADLVKFAGHDATLEQARLQHSSICSWVEALSTARQQEEEGLP